MLTPYEASYIIAYINSYKAPEIPELSSEYYGPDPYDINWVMPLHEATLKSDRVKLTPFIPSLHAREYTKQTTTHPELHRRFVFDLTSLNKILMQVELTICSQPLPILFTIINKACRGALVGVIGLLNTLLFNLSTEIGWVIMFPVFQCMYVSSNAISLLLQYCLELPSDLERPGLGFRRVQ
jgi:hypothetical protein